jgi:DNA-binding transcriptional MerR regulator
MKITTSHRLYMKAVEARRTKIKKLKGAGMTWTAIGKALGITRQRAQQIGTKP